MATVSKGVVVKVRTAKKYEHAFKPGTLATSEGEDFGPHHRGLWSLFRNEEGETQYLLPEHYDLVEAADEVSDETLPNKVIYGVLNAADEIYASTADRDFAREMKAALGGKRKGIRIFQYAAVKEIR
ncbi:hypothetical protein vB_PsyM_KIL2_0112 [Pseudomonas phage vB_PsyM_KIL2]|uniref:Uncharacterized protein n=1 Tax=Pseudomonas phage vB_PsyM_KIL2 TaxID=1777066 RepID=A0A142IE57_9CAUD|nr:hypothetical protein vB_PsyM_KIL2_0112 [Pseudomonas phage vB_PsyM_KIL2]